MLSHSPSINEVPSSLYGAANWHFGNWNKAKIAAGLEIRKQNNALKESSRKLSNDLAYVLGVVAGDGCASYSKNNHGTKGTISLGVTDKDFAETFKIYLERWSSYTSKLQKYGNKYYVTFNSVDATKFVKNFDLKAILRADKKVQIYFIRGLFDSEGGVIGKNLTKGRYAKRWIHFSNSDKEIIYLVSTLLSIFGISYKLKSRVHSGFGSKKLQYEIIIYGLKNIFKYYKQVGFNIHRKQNKLIEVIKSYNFYTEGQFKKAKELHKIMSFRKVAKNIGVSEAVVYRWLFKDYKEKILNLKEEDKWLLNKKNKKKQKNMR